ncbi:TetR/AcrR family transcriptional regulator [Sphingobium sp. Sx8-8]|uniref:TetR/AcrR family transcriptional regulator n=1 Tax=Sphingobium sp. Sx8-8 TaxID=2933617 RepID=UPI001F5994FC|nr:TetR/AcrR family transcriptional regulator [Sphingobium sp. Sx8-8]
MNRDVFQPLGSAVPPKPIYGAQPVGDPLLDAAAVCVNRKGFDNTSLEEVAAEAGVSRTTLYRRFGNRESLFAALLYARSEPFRQWSRSILTGPGSVADRLETVIVHAILEMQRVGWLDESFRAGVSPLAARLMKGTYKQSREDGLALLVNTLVAARPEWARSIVGDEVLDWVMEQMIDFAATRNWEEEDLRRRVRFFVIPALVGNCLQDSISTRLDAIENKIDRLIGKR